MYAMYTNRTDTTWASSDTDALCWVYIIKLIPLHVALLNFLMVTVEILVLLF